MFIRIDFIQPYLIQAWIKGIRGHCENLKYLLLSFVSNLWSIWTYRNKAIVNKEPLSATPLMWSMYCKSLISMCRVTNSSVSNKSLDSSRISKSTPLESVPTGNQPCWMRAERVIEGNRIQFLFIKIDVHVRGRLFQLGC